MFYPKNLVIRNGNPIISDYRDSTVWIKNISNKTIPVFSSTFLLGYHLIQTNIFTKELSGITWWTSLSSPFSLIISSIILTRQYSSNSAGIWPRPGIQACLCALYSSPACGHRRKSYSHNEAHPVLMVSWKLGCKQKHK